MKHDQKDLLPQVVNMLSKDGLYLIQHPSEPNQCVPIWVKNGQAFSMQLDSMLCPAGFTPEIQISGPLIPPLDCAKAPFDPSVN